jgi:hypothetical protein
MADFKEGTTNWQDTLSKGAGAAANKAVAYGNKWLDNKINFGLNYAKNYARKFDFFGILPEQWTLLDDAGEKAFEFDSFSNLNLKSESKVIQAPVENGSFVMYNKTNTPLEISCTLIKKGFPEGLQTYVDALLEYADNTKLLSIVTPDREYQNMNLTSVSFSRSAEGGVNLIMAECAFTEIRQVTPEYTSARVGKKVSRGRQQGKPRSMLSYLKGGFK